MERSPIMAARVGKSHGAAVRRTGDPRINLRGAVVEGRKPVPF
jgi:hypothetical protein